MPRIDLSLLLAILLILGLRLLPSSAKTTDAQIVTVQRGDVHQVLPLTGNIAYADMAYIYAEGSGQIARVCVAAGQRVGEGEALVRLEATADSLPKVIRAQYPCTIREVYVATGAAVPDGACLMRISSNQQVIRCIISAEDAKQLRVGMWGWASVAGESLGLAKVTSVDQAVADAAIASLALLPEQWLGLPEGATLDVAIFLAGSDDVLTLPLDAITCRNTVWWVHNEICTEIPAEVVMCDEKSAWVRLPEGLSVAMGEFKEGQRIRSVSN